MPNLVVNLPLPVLNGPGALVDTSGMGNPKTIEIVGDFRGTTIAVEISEDDVSFAPLVVFQDQGGVRVLPAAAKSMRVNVRGRKASLPFSADCDVASNDFGAMFIALPLPAGNGPGPAVDTSLFGAASTFVCGGSFPGAVVTVEVSEDNSVWASIGAFASQGGQFSALVTAAWVRTNVANRKASLPFAASLSMGAVNDGGGGSGGIGVDDEGVPIGVGPFTELDFVGAGVSAVDAGSGIATITIPGGITGVGVEDEGAPIGAGPYSEFNFVGRGIAAADVGGVATVTVPTPAIEIQDEGVPLTGTYPTINFTGAGVTAVDVAGDAVVTIPGGISGIDVEDEGVGIANNPHSTMNFVGGGVAASDVGGVATVTVPTPAITIEDEGVGIANNPHSVVNFVGAGVTVTDVGGVATVNVPTPAVPTAVSYLPEQWNQNGITAAQSQVPLSALVSVNFDMIQAIRAGSIVGIRTRINGGPVTAGSLKVTVSKNGALGTLAVTSTSIANQNGGVAIQAAGVDSYVAGDLLGVMVELASGDLAPAGTMNIEVQLQIAETI